MLANPLIRAQRSSANTNFLVGIDIFVIMLLIYLINNSGDNMPPWGTPLLIFINVKALLREILIEWKII